MMECECRSSKLKAYNFSNLDYILFYVDKWIISDPSKTDLFYSTKRQYTIKCQDCNNEWQDEIKEAFSPKITHNEITLDLDHTLVHVTEDYYFDNTKTDKKIKHPDINSYYSLTKRPHMDMFIKECCKIFDKINFYTASHDWYAKEVMEVIKIPKEKLGYIKTFKDTTRERPLSFEWEMMKHINNSLVIDDKPLVVKGYNNIVYKIPSFSAYSKENDTELLKALEIFKKKEFTIKIPDTFDCIIELFLKNTRIELKNISLDLISTIFKEVKIITKEELSLLPVHTTLYYPYLDVINNQGRISMVDINYNNYETLCYIIRNHTNHQKFTPQEFNNLIR